MKCEKVESIIVEYAEGALCVADELCVDIHLVQCASCRAEARSVVEFQESIANAFRPDASSPRTVELLERLDSLVEPIPRPFLWRRWSGTALRAALVTAFVVILFSAGAATWRHEAPEWFPVPSAEAAIQRPIVSTVRPLASDAELRELDDLNDLAGPPETTVER